MRIKSRRRWVGNVACMGKIRNSAKFQMAILNLRGSLEEVSVEGVITLKQI
jgi:hypothetical protein